MKKTKSGPPSEQKVCKCGHPQSQHMPKVAASKKTQEKEGFNVSPCTACTCIDFSAK